MSAITCPSCQRPVALTADGPTKCPHCGSPFPVFSAPPTPSQPVTPATPQPPDPFRPPESPSQAAEQTPAATPARATPLPPGSPTPAKPIPTAKPIPAAAASTTEQPIQTAAKPSPSEGPAPVAKPVRSNRRRVTVEVPTATAVMDFFDFSFQKYLTPVIVKITWVVTLVMGGIWILVLTLGVFADWLPDDSGQTSVRTNSTVISNGYEQQFDRINRNRGSIISVMRFVTWLTGIVSAIVGCLWIRVGLECVIVFFNISTTLTDIKQDLRSPPDNA